MKRKVVLLITITIMIVVGYYAVEEVDRYYVESCNLYGWDFSNYFPPTCKLPHAEIELERLRIMYPDATPFPELPKGRDKPNDNFRPIDYGKDL